MKAETKKIILTSVITSALTVALCIGIAFLSIRTIDRSASAPVGIVATALQTNNSDVVSIVKRVNPAVVSIIITEEIPVIQQYYRRRSPFGIPYWVPGQPSGTQKVEVGGGSGFFITSEGYIITNRHVVDLTDANYTVLTNDGKEHPARVVYRDSTLDIALIKIEGSGYPYLTFGDSSKLEVGQSVIAIGNALGEFSNTVSVGVISGLGRSIVAGDSFGNAEQVEQAIQTDAAINVGNSGGPLIDGEGLVIGVNVATASEAQSISFALPSNSVAAAVNSFLRR